MLIGVIFVDCGSAGHVLEYTLRNQIFVEEQMSQAKIKETINKIRGALGDPRAPWYGSDVVSWVGDLIEEYEKLRPLAEAGEFTKEFRKLLNTIMPPQMPGPQHDYDQFGRSACGIIDHQTAELKTKNEKFDTLANHLIDMSHAITGWREAVAFNNKGDLIDELERMVNKALKLVPQF